MNKPIYEINNSFNLSQIFNKNFEFENEIKVDEISDEQNDINNIKNSKSINNIFELTEKSFLKKHSLNNSFNQNIIKEVDNNGPEDKIFNEKLIQSIEEKK